MTVLAGTPGVLESRAKGQTDGECRGPSLQRWCQYRAGDVGGSLGFLFFLLQG